MPTEVAALLDSREETRGLAVDVVFPEHRIRFDKLAGEPRNADLAFLSGASDRKVAVTVEARADETFRSSVARTICDASERAISSPASCGVSLAWAEQQEADFAVLVVHEFITNRTHASRHVSNDADFKRFGERLAGDASTFCVDGPVLCGQTLCRTRRATIREARTVVHRQGHDGSA